MKIHCLCAALFAIAPVSLLEAQQPTSERRLLFAREIDNRAQLVIVDEQGREQSRLLDDNAYDSYPAWSPDGQRIAFTSTRFSENGRRQIVVMDADGRNLKQLTTGDPNRCPTWSPDGKRIAFNRHLLLENGKVNLEIFVMDADGTNLVNLTNDTAFDGDPAWSPTGKHIAFASNRDGKYALYVMDTDGGNVRLLSQPWSVGWVWPAWSPDGKHIAYTDKDARGAYVMTVCDTDGGNRRHLTSGGFDTFAAWSPDGKRIAFVRINSFNKQRVGVGDLYVMDANGDNAKLLQRAVSHSERGRPAWSVRTR